MNNDDKLMDIYGHYACYDDYYHLDDSWLGRVIVHKDKTFEGVAESYEGDYRYLLVGNVGDGFINCFVNGGNFNNPRLYKDFVCGPDKTKYYGSCYVTDGYFDLAIGESKISLRPAEKIREVTDGEISSLRRFIEETKESLTDKQRKGYEQILESNYTTKPIIEDKKIK